VFKSKVMTLRMMTPSITIWNDSGFSRIHRRALRNFRIAALLSFFRVRQGDDGDGDQDDEKRFRPEPFREPENDNGPEDGKNKLERPGIVPKPLRELQNPLHRHSPFCRTIF